MLRIDQETPFLASWNASNAHLNLDADGTLSGLARRVRNFVC